jgi:hypothetical protein
MFNKEKNTFLPTTPEYQNFLDLLKQQIQHSRIVAIRGVNTTLITLYYEI